MPGLLSRPSRQFVKDFKDKTPSERLGMLQFKITAMNRCFLDDFDCTVRLFPPLPTIPRALLPGVAWCVLRRREIMTVCVGDMFCTAQSLMQFMLDHEKKAREKAAQPAPMVVS